MSSPCDPSTVTPPPQAYCRDDDGGRRNPRGGPFIKATLAALVFLVLCKIGLTAVRLFPGCPSLVAQAPKAMVVADAHAQQPSRMTAHAAVSAKATPPDEATQNNTDVSAVSPETWAAIREQKKLLESKEMELKEREARLREMEQEIENRLKELIAVQDKIKQAQQEIQAFREEREQARNAQVQALAKIYGNMKPKEAGQLLESLEEPLAVKVISLMSPDQVAKILASMETKKAAKISRALTGR